MLLPAAAVGAKDVHSVDLPGAIENYCTECHNETDWAGGLALTILDPAHVD